MVTGASAGVGRAAAIAFAREGACVGLLARGRAGLDGARRDVMEAGGSAVVLQADVADAAAVSEAADTLARVGGGIDVWVNNAMASVFSPVNAMTPEEFARVTAVTYLGVVHGTLAALRHMRPRRRGHIVQVGSALAYRGIPLQSAYCAAKHAVQGFCDSLRTELLHEGNHIHLTMVQLPALNTPQFEWVKSRLPGRAQPVPPIYRPEVAADAIVWASHRRQREVIVGWPSVVSIMGNKVAPGLADRYLSRTGYASQQTSEPERPGRPHNLWTPVDQEWDFGVQGRFAARAHGHSPQFWLHKHRWWIASCAAAAAVGAAVSSASRTRGKA
jgi:NAD(P)-dependent dehydrogenase (short-subunit alcohol dehydrogenase family)